MSSRLRPSSTPIYSLLFILVRLVLVLSLLLDGIGTKNGSSSTSIFALAKAVGSSENKIDHDVKSNVLLGTEEEKGCVGGEEYQETGGAHITNLPTHYADGSGGSCTDGMPYTTRDFFHHYDCESILLSPSPLPIYEQNTWMRLRKAYIAVGVTNSTIHVPIKEESGFHVPYYVSHSPDSGRGVYAKEPILKGQKVWTGIGSQSAYFKTGDEFRRFLHLVGDAVVCDLLIWCYPTYWEMRENEKSLWIACDLDEGSLINEGDDITAKNIEISRLKGNDTDFLYASRDIEAGEELLMRYDDFTGGGLWKKFGLESVWVEDGEVGFEG